ncbi:peptidase s41 family protein [Colletotrichum truncatum]|uniref:Peptidase s41 family protein n=1 Tax=Colletotrichum truncatum TaxID=5467 RepID=A0ACC3YWB9_COLTU|nr:peptidase s41 family protein [Colletotrichum truncatum]KAF6787363.1 peptidase s41 family protein [Colletotrichum truncatum]
MRFTWWMVAYATAALAAPRPQQPPGTPTNSTPTTTAPTMGTPPPGAGGNANACGQIQPMVNQFLQASPKASPQVPAQLAFDCLQSVPNKPQPAQDLIKSLKAYVQWQSTLSWLKNPPGSYMLPPTDIEGGLTQIGEKATAGGYKSEYDFQLEIFQLFASAHDGHFAFRGDVFKGFSFRNKLASDIVSVSRDGLEVPKLYHLGQLDKNGSAPAIIRINGRDAATIIEDLNLKFSGFQDPDSQWNSQFKSYASKDSAPIVAAALAFQGSKVTITYDNGEERSEDSFALIRTGANFTGVNNGEDFYNKFCNPETAPKPPSNGTKPEPPKTSSPPPPPLPTIEGYPWPVIRDSGANTTSGYYLNGTGYDDVAVLAVSAFSPPDNIDATEYLTNFQNTVAKFLAESKKDGKKKLVIDVAANGGGFVVAGFELFAQLFPDVNRFQANNLRLTDSMNNLARLAAAIPANFTPSSQEEKEALDALSGSAVVSNLLPGGVFTVDQKDFQSVDQILGPVSLNGDTFTAYQEAPLNMSDPSFNLTGVGSKANPPPRVFAPEDVVLFTDGTCGSTCTIFSYLMILQMGIKTTVIGGRPQNGIMQSIAGVEGAQVFSFNDLTSDAKSILALAPKDKKEELQNSELGELAKGYAIKRATTPKSAGAVNGKNAFSMADARTPLQFLWEPANCRIFFTHEMISKPDVAWKRVVDATWSNPTQFCVSGSQVPVNKTTTLDPFFRAGKNTPGVGSAASDLVTGAGMRLAVLVATFTVALLSL